MDTEPTKKEKCLRKYQFLDMWMAAIMELDERGSLDGIDRIIGEFEGLDAPQHSQTSMSTRDAWLHYQFLPNRRAFQFMTTLPAPMQNMFKMFGEQSRFIKVSRHTFQGNSGTHTTAS